MEELMIFGAPVWKVAFAEYDTDPLHAYACIADRYTGFKKVYRNARSLAWTKAVFYGMEDDQDWLYWQTVHFLRKWIKKVEYR